MKSTLLDKSFRILDRIASSSVPVTLKELASDLEINSSTASRITSDLAERNLIRKAGYHSFVPATGLIRLAKASVDTPLVRTVREIISARASELGVNGLFAGIDSGHIVYLYTGETAHAEHFIARIPPWRSHLAAVILSHGGKKQTELFFKTSLAGENTDIDASRELSLFNSRCRMAAENGYLVFRDPRLGWSVNFPVQVPEEVFGVSLWGRDTDNCNMERMQFECARLASKLTSELGNIFYG